MREMINSYIKLKEKIDQNDYNDINNLQNIVLRVDKAALKLEIDYKLSRRKSETKGDNCINEFMYYDDKKLIGYIGISQFGGDALEVNGMVHPEYRRRGVFKRLFFLVKDEWSKRESQKMLLLCDSNSNTGLEFIKYTGALHEHSEYEMYLKNNPEKDLALKNLVLRKAINKDGKEIALQDSIYFDIEFKEDDISMPEEEEKNGNITYLGEVEGKAVGKVRLEIIDGIGGIYGLGILPEYRGKGYGREILTRGIEKLKEDKTNKIMLQVATKNKNALNLYKSCGFVETSTMEYYELNSK